MASTAMRSRAGAAVRQLLSFHQRSSPAAHHLLPPTIHSSGFHPEGCSPFPLGQSLRSYSNSRPSLGFLHGGNDRALGTSLTLQDGRIYREGSEGGRWFWDQQDGKRRQSASTSKTSETDGEAFASEIIGYAASQRQSVAMHTEVCRVLEQGYNFLVSQGPSTAGATARVLFTLATGHVDWGKLEDAIDALQLAGKLDGASAEVRVSASQALVGVLLRMYKDTDALSEAKSMASLVRDVSGLPPQLLEELTFRAAATLQFAEHVTSSKTSGTLLDMSSLSSWLNDKEAHVEGVAAALVGIAECYHIRGHLSDAKDYYEKALALAERGLERGSVEFSAVAMAADEVVVRAQAGLGQTAMHLGEFDDAEKYLTNAMKSSEQINGDKNPRVGPVLACLAEVYARRAIIKGSGDIILPEALYRATTDELRAGTIDIAPVENVNNETPISNLRLPAERSEWSDVIALTRGRYAALLSRVQNRQSEAEKLRAWADAVWKGPCPFKDVLAQDASTRPQESVTKDEELQRKENGAFPVRYVVIDAGLGRVLFAPTNN